MKVFNKLEEWLGGSLFIAMFIVLVMQIFARQIFNSPLIWSEELSRLIFVYVGLLGVSMGIRSQQHIMIDFLYAKFPKSMQKIVFTIIQILILACLIFFLYFGYDLFIKKEELEIVSLGISMKWMYLALPLITLLMLVRFYQAYSENYAQNKVCIKPIFILALMIILVLISFIKPELFKVLKLSNYFDLGEMTIYYVLIAWLVMIFFGVPVGWSLLVACILYFALTRWKVVYFAADKLVYSLDSFSLLSVPFFILTGILMNG